MDAYARKWFLFHLECDFTLVERGACESPPIFGPIGWMLHDPRPWDIERSVAIAGVVNPVARLAV